VPGLAAPPADGHVTDIGRINRDEPDVIMAKIREEKDGRGNKSGICGDFPLKAGRCGRHPLESGSGHPAATGTR